MSCESPVGLGEQKWLGQLSALVEKDGSPFLLFLLVCGCSREMAMWVLIPQSSSPACALLAASCCLWHSPALPCTGAVAYLYQLMLLSTGYEDWYDKIVWVGFFFFFFDYISLFLLFLGIISNAAINFGCVQYKNSTSWKCILFNIWLKFHLSQTRQVCQGHVKYGPNFMPVLTL